MAAVIVPDAPGRRETVLAVARGVLTTVFVLVAFVLLPVGEVFEFGVVFWFAVGVALVAGSLVLQLRSIARARHPELRAIEAIGILLPVGIVAFASVYLVLSQRDPAAFSEPLGPVDAIYYTVAVLTTVGFGDITAVSPVARVLVTVQMLVGLVLLGAVVRLIGSAAARAAGRG